MKKLESVQVIFENCEYTDIPASAVEALSYVIVTTHVVHGTEKELIELDTVKKVRLHLNDGYKNINVENFSPPTPFIDRINAYRDVAQLSLKYDDGKFRTLFIKWKGEDENTRQTVTINETGMIICL